MTDITTHRDFNRNNWIGVVSMIMYTDVYNLY